MNISEFFWNDRERKKQKRRLRRMRNDKDKFKKSFRYRKVKPEHYFDDRYADLEDDESDWEA